mmetsp:Transcript_9444/g.28523  ORF Transcript_9444/g.28523 Transcript_9444/m.28523 type:complete len:690 (+) Transcript_9444:1-2070(+)
MQTKKQRHGVFKFFFGGGQPETERIRNKVTRSGHGDKLGVDYLEALLILLRNPSSRVLLEVIIGLSRRNWSTWIDVPVPSHALFDSPDYDDARLGGAVDLGTATYGDSDNSDEEFLKGDKLVQEKEDLQTAMGDRGRLGNFFDQKREKRRLQRELQAENNAPFYLRKMGEGMIPALEVVMKRILGGVLSDEPCRRIGSLRAAVALARAKLYTDSREQQELFKRVKESYYGSGSMPPQVKSATTELSKVTFEDDAQQHILEPLVKHFKFLVEEETCLYVRCKAAEALLLFVAAGAGTSLEEAFAAEDEAQDAEKASEARAKGSNVPDNAQNGDQGPLLEGKASNGRRQSEPSAPRRPLLLRLFEHFLCNTKVNEAVLLRAIGPFMDSLIFEITQIAPQLCEQVVMLVESFAIFRGSKGVCGHLFDVWESVLSLATITAAKVVGRSVQHCAMAGCSRERIVGTAAQFLRRRVLDLSVIAAGEKDLMSAGVPTPLPQRIGTEMEGYFSLLYHGVLMGPSPESRQNFLDALGGAAVLAGDPFRISTYEKLCELIIARGLGLRAGTEFILRSFDTLYAVRERFAEARVKMQEQGGITSRTREELWLRGVWRLAVEASVAATSLLGAPPPPGWQPLGPEGEFDVRAAEEAFGDFRVNKSETQPEVAASSGATADLNQDALPGSVEALQLPPPAAK